MVVTYPERSLEPPYDEPLCFACEEPADENHEYCPRCMDAADEALARAIREVQDARGVNRAKAIELIEDAMWRI